MLWPVALDTHPRDATWSVGERVTTRLRWLDDPQLPDDLVLRDVVVRAHPLLDADGRPWAQVVEAGGLRAVREGDHRGGVVTVGGCPGVDAGLGLIEALPVTTGVVRRVRVVHDRYDRGLDGWTRRPGDVRLTDVPDAGPERLRDDWSGAGTPPDPQAGPGTLQFLSPEQYFRLSRDRLPAQRWEVRGSSSILTSPILERRGMTLAGSVPGVGIYLVDISAPSWAQDECAPLLDEALAARGLPPYPGPPARAADFEEKLSLRMDDFAEICARHDAAEFLDATLIVPVDFSGLIELPVESAYDDVTKVFSAQRLRAAIAPIAAEVGLAADLPSGPMALTTAIEDAVTFYVALFASAAEHSVRHGCPLTYV
ncbi:hypothetical protein ODJ79_02685 [Actinoplanes sp. KI2]|uniref:hypothetical protein n=1 Tax=Actinoplanes sp. KI2 TaxID=2983315 RepID=UPI0021D5F4E2|nr:hypothetical protein [Actinoplanes sp. KI2]MCU7722613.1 hypothetical protein [Actinoplanes sp. KI2]